MPTLTPHAVSPFYRLRFAVTGMSMLSAVLLPWLVYTATGRLAAAGLVMLLEALVRLLMSLYGGQLAHAIGGRRSFALAQLACTLGFVLFAGVLAAYPASHALAFALLVGALLAMQSGITLGNVVTEACTVAFVQTGIANVPARVRAVDLGATACALPLGGWLVFAFDAPLALIALGAALAAGAAFATHRAGAIFDYADTAARARFSLVDAAVWRWLGGSPVAQLQTLFLLVVSVPVTMLFGALPFLLAGKLPAGLPDWVRPTDVLFLTHYKALEAATAAGVVFLWTRVAGARAATAATFALAAYLAALIGLTHASSAVGVAVAALALAAAFSPLLVFVRQERAGLVPSGNRQRVSGVLVALDSLAYVAGAIVVQTAGFASATLGAIALVATLLFAALMLASRVRVAVPQAGPQAALPPLAEKLAIYRRYLSEQREYIETRLADAVPRLGLVKRATPPPTYLTPLAVSPVAAVKPIGCGLTPLVLPRALYEAGLRTARVAAHSEEIAATRRPLDAVRADAAAQGWSPRVLAHLLPDSPAELESRLAASFHRLRVDLLLRPPHDPGDAHRDPLASRFAPLEVNNGGSQGHWICSAVNDVLLAGLGLEGRPVFDNPHALIVEVYEAFNEWLRAALGRRRFRALFPRGKAPLAFVTGPYSGRLVNDIEGPRIAEFIARRYDVDAGYFIGLEDLQLCDTVEVAGRRMHFVRRRGAPEGQRFVLWSDLYITESMAYFEAALGEADPLTRRLARSLLSGRVLGISAWPGRELIENDKGHLVEKAHASERASALGLTMPEAALLQDAAPDAFALTAAQAELVSEARDAWVLKGRFGCGGSAVIVGAHPSWPTQRLPAVETDADGRRQVRMHPIVNIATAANIALELDAEGRITTASWTRLWPVLVQFAARSPGYYVAQSFVQPEPFHAMIYDGRRMDEFAATTDFAAAYTLGWRNGRPRVKPAGTLCRAVPRGHPHTNITTRGALLPVMSEDEFDRLYLALGLDRYVAPAKSEVTAPDQAPVAPGVVA